MFQKQRTQPENLKDADIKNSVDCVKFTKTFEISTDVLITAEVSIKDLQYQYVIKPHIIPQLVS